MFRTRPTRRRAPSIEALEPRLLFSADPVGATDAAAAAWAAAAAPEAIAWQAQPAADTSAAQVGEERSAAPRELALVDIRVPDAARLLAELEGQRDAGRPIDVLVVGEGDDAIAVLDAALSGASGTYGAVHLFGHGEPGSMQLGDGVLDLAALRARAGEVAGWSHGLTEGADLLLWGCDAGSGPAGAALLDALSALTGADVAASTDTTGGLAAGGNWVLEAARGSIEATVPIGAALRIEFAGSLALAPVTGEVAVATAQASQETSGTTSTAGRQVAASAAGTVLVWVDPDGERILAQRYAADGSVRGGLITVDENDEGPRMPSVAMDDAGNLLVAWSVDGQARASWISATSLAANVTNFDGTSFKINSGDGSVPTSGQVSVDLSANGQWGVVVWTEVDIGSRDISAQRLAISGGSGATLSGAKIEITESQGLSDDHPDAGIGNDGAISVVLHSDWSLFNWDSGIYAFRVEAGSSVATPAASTTGLRVSPDLPAYTDAHASPAFALGADGRGLAAWIDTRNGSLWTRVIGPTGPVGTAVSITLESGHAAGRPSVAAVEGGGWVVAWETSIGGTAYGIRAIRVDAAGVAATGGAYHVDMNMPGDQRAPSVAVSGNRVVIAWTGPGGGESGATALVMRTFTMGGELAIDAVPTIPVDENAIAATAVTLRASIDGVTQTGVTWSLDPDTPAGLVHLDAASGVLTVLAGLDYETLAGGIELGGGERAYDFDVTATTGGGSPRSTMTSIRVVLSNVHDRAPQLTVPATLAGSEDVVRVLSSGDGSAVSASVDAAATRLDLVLSADRGTLTLGAVAGLDFTGGSDGTDDATIRFGGSPADVAAALASLSFRLPADQSGSVTITVSLTDAGLGGPGVSGTIALTVAAVNDAPVAGPATPSPVSLELGASAPVGVAALLAADVDDGADRIVYELVAPSSLGDLRLDGVVLAAGATFTQADVDSGRVSFAAREVGTATVSLRLADAGGEKAGTTTLAIEVKAPVVAPSAMAEVLESAPALAADPAPVAEPAQAAMVAPRAAAAQPSFVATRSSAAFSSLSSSVGQSDGGDAGSTRSTVTQAAQAASDGGSAGAASGTSASPAVAQPTGVVVRVGTGGTGAVAAVGAPGAAAPAASAAAGGVQTGGAALGGVQAVAVVASFAGAAGPSGAGAQLGWHDTGSGPVADGGGGAGMGSVGGPIGGGTGGTWTRARGGPSSTAALPLDAWSPAVALRQAEFRAELAQARDDAATRFETHQALVASSVAVSTSLSIGYVVWLARGGVLLTSLLASMPAWRSIDPLPVLARVDARGRDDAEDDDSLRGLLKHAADRRAALAEAQAESEARHGAAQVAPDPA